MSAKISTAIRKNMENSTLIKGTVGNILIKEPWLPKKKSYIEIRSDKRYYKMFINSKFDKLSIFFEKIPILIIFKFIIF